jgi:hypothetical protein
MPQKKPKADKQGKARVPDEELDKKIYSTPHSGVPSSAQQQQVADAAANQNKKAKK